MFVKKFDFKKIKTTVTDVFRYWKKPREGQYVSYKEFLYFIIGAGASNTASYAGSNLSFSAGCLFVGAIYGMKMMDFVMLGFVNMILNYLFSPIGMVITDNLGNPPKKTMKTINLANVVFFIVGVLCFFVPHEPFEGFMPALPQVVGAKFLVQVFCTYWNIFVYRKFSPKFGKYRCWIVANCIPYMISLLALTWFPYDRFEYHTKFWIMHLMFCFMNCFVSWYSQTTNVQNVISPDTGERTKIMSIGSFVYSLFPSLYNIVFPVCAAWAGGMTDIKTYKIVVPIAIAVMTPIALFLGFKVTDKVIQEEDHKPQVSMISGFKQVLKNKYLWIVNASSWISMFAGGAINMVNIIIIYSMRKDYIMGVFSTILGTAYTPGMLLTPWLVKKFGKKKLTLICKYTSLICSFLSVTGVYLNSVAVILLSTYISTMLTSVSQILANSITADLWDYQQYISGERLDGCMGIFGYISQPVTTVAALVVPMIYDRFGFTSDWNILYNQDIRNKIFFATIILSAVVGIISALPYHFYDFTEKRHNEIIEKLRQKSLAAEAEEAAGEKTAVTEG